MAVTKTNRSADGLISPVSPPGSKQPLYKRRDKIASSTDFESYYASHRHHTKPFVAHTIALKKDYEENVYNLVKSNTIPKHLESDTEIFEWLLERAFKSIEEGK